MKKKDEDQENLQKLLQGFRDEYVDNTDYLREVKRSTLFRTDILCMEHLKSEYSSIMDIKSEEFADICRMKCSFLFNEYTMIFNKVLNG